MLAGALVVLRWMPGRPQPVAEPAAGPVTELAAEPAAGYALAGDDPAYAAELAILEENVLERSEREG